jgi:deoxyribodipyrimidine photo-lyase
MICLQMLGTGSGRRNWVDAAPYFRVFNPEIQQKFDKTEPIRQWIKEFDLGYGEPMVEHAMARNRAIATYKGIIK